MEAHRSFASGVVSPRSPVSVSSVDPDALFSLARALSARLAEGVGPGCQVTAEVSVSAEVGVVDRLEALVPVALQAPEAASRCPRSAAPLIETNSVVIPISLVQLEVAGQARVGDHSAWDAVEWVVGSPSELPSEDALNTAVDALAARLGRWCSAKPLAEAWTGPVLVEGEAAVALTAGLLLPAFSGTPPREEGGSFRRPEQLSRLRKGRRVLPPGVDADDEPSRWPELASSRGWDAEGVTSEPVALVRDGILRGQVQCRTVGAGEPRSTGHATGSAGEFKRAVVSQVRIAARRPASTRALLAQGLRLAAAYTHDHVLVVRRFQPLEQHPLNGYETPSVVTDPIDAVFRYRDGREEPVRGLRVTGVGEHTLSHAVPGPSARLTFMLRSKRLDGASPATLETPSWLLQEATAITSPILEVAPAVPLPPRAGL